MKHSLSSLILFLSLSMLACSEATTAPPQEASQAHPVGTNRSRLPPHYLSIKKFKQCLGETQPKLPGDAVFLCLPKVRPTPCPLSSWEQIKNEFKEHPCPQ